MAEINAAASGTFTIGGDLTVRRLGFGAMRITGPGIWGEPADLAEARRVLTRLPSQVALSWVLRRSPVMLPIPGTGQVKHLEENTAAAALELSPEDFAALDAQGKQAWKEQSGG